MGKYCVALDMIKHPSRLSYYLLLKSSKLIKDDRKYIELVWKHQMNYPLNLDNPQTFNEKLQWIKLYDRRPVYTTMVDKYAVKQYVANIIGQEYVIPTLGVWDKPKEIEWDKLPNQFVLKCTHDSGGLVICHDKTQLDKKAAIEKLNKSLKFNYYLAGREWPYKNVPRRIIAEKYMEDSDGELKDYKLFCFNGKVKALFIASDRQTKYGPYFDFFDEKFNHLDIRHGHPNASVPPKKPQSFDLMIELAEKLSSGFPELRVDFYDVDGKVYFGELTLFHHNGTVPFDPEQWDSIFGAMIELPSNNKRF